MTYSDPPRTLLDIAGVPSADVDLSEAVLVLIDFQNEYIDGSLPLPDGLSACKAAAELLSQFRSLAAPIIHVVHHGSAGAALFNPQTKNVLINKMLAPKDEEIVIEKTLPNAFEGTDLESEIRATGRNTVVLCGFMTHMCISSTARRGTDLGFRNVVVASACASRALPKPQAGAEILSAKAIHEASLASIADRFAVVVKSLSLK